MTVQLSHEAHQFFPENYTVEETNYRTETTDQLLTLINTLVEQSASTFDTRVVHDFSDLLDRVGDQVTLERFVSRLVTFNRPDAVIQLYELGVMKRPLEQVLMHALDDVPSVATISRLRASREDFRNVMSSPSFVYFAFIRYQPEVVDYLLQSYEELKQNANASYRELLSHFNAQFLRSSDNYKTLRKFLTLPWMRLNFRESLAHEESSRHNKNCGMSCFASPRIKKFASDLLRYVETKTAPTSLLDASVHIATEHVENLIRNSSKAYTDGVVVAVGELFAGEQPDAFTRVAAAYAAPRARVGSEVHFSQGEFLTLTNTLKTVLSVFAKTSEAGPEIALRVLTSTQTIADAVASGLVTTRHDIDKLLEAHARQQQQVKTMQF